MEPAGGAVASLDGSQLYQAFASGLAGVQRRRDYLNRINVFPVPDGDTGTNVVVTLSYALEVAEVSDSAGETLSSIADAALAGARGNSGVIFAQFLGGLSESLDDAPRVAKEAHRRRRRARRAARPRGGHAPEGRHDPPGHASLGGGAYPRGRRRGVSSRSTPRGS